jgi:hypothetical protein
MTSAPPPLESCPGCGRLYPPSDATHTHIGASPGCWTRYCELLALEYGDARLMRWHRLTADAYAAQHPGVPERRSAQSVHVHLAGLYLTLERGLVGKIVARAMQRLADGRAHAWLEPPPLATAIGVPELIEAAGGPFSANAPAPGRRPYGWPGRPTTQRSAPRPRRRSLHIMPPAPI